MLSDNTRRGVQITGRRPAAKSAWGVNSAERGELGARGELGGGRDRGERGELGERASTRRKGVNSAEGVNSAKGRTRRKGVNSAKRRELGGRRLSLFLCLRTAAPLERVGRLDRGVWSRPHPTRSSYADLPHAAAP